MALFGDRLAREVVARVRRRHDTLGEALGESPSGATESLATQCDEEGGPLLRDLRLLIAVANGEHARTDRMVEAVAEALARVVDALFGTAFDLPPRIPEAFWRSDLGVVVSRARWWVSMDDLITISAAATLAFGENTQATRMRIARAIEHGTLQWVPDPSVANPQQRKRVLRSEVERLRDLARLAAADEAE